MKKILSVMLVMFCLMLTSCNMSLGFGNYNFKKIHCTINNECYSITSWHDNERGIEVKTTEFGALFFSEGTYILVEDKCPICDK